MKEDKTEERVPLFRTWAAWYWTVMLTLVALIILFYLFTEHFA